MRLFVNFLVTSFIFQVHSLDTPVDLVPDTTHDATQEATPQMWIAVSAEALHLFTSSSIQLRFTQSGPMPLFGVFLKLYSAPESQTGELVITRSLSGVSVVSSCNLETRGRDVAVTSPDIWTITQTNSGGRVLYNGKEVLSIQTSKCTLVTAKSERDWSEPIEWFKFKVNNDIINVESRATGGCTELPEWLDTNVSTDVVFPVSAERKVELFCKQNRFMYEISGNGTLICNPYLEDPFLAINGQTPSCILKPCQAGQYWLDSWTSPHWSPCTQCADGHFNTGEAVNEEEAKHCQSCRSETTVEAGRGINATSCTFARFKGADEVDISDWKLSGTLDKDQNASLVSDGDFSTCVVSKYSNKTQKNYLELRFQASTVIKVVLYLKFYEDWYDLDKNVNDSCVASQAAYRNCKEREKGLQLWIGNKLTENITISAAPTKQDQTNSIEIPPAGVDTSIRLELERETGIISMCEVAIVVAAEPSHPLMVHDIKLEADMGPDQGAWAGADGNLYSLYVYNGNNPIQIKQPDYIEITLPYSTKVARVIVYDYFYTTSATFLHGDEVGRCLESAEDYKACKRGVTLRVDLESSGIRVAECGTIALSSGLTSLDQIYDLPCKGDNVTVNGLTIATKDQMLTMAEVLVIKPEAWSSVYGLTHLPLDMQTAGLRLFSYSFLASGETVTVTFYQNRDNTGNSRSKPQKRYSRVAGRIVIGFFSELSVAVYGCGEVKMIPPLDITGNELIWTIIRDPERVRVFVNGDPVLDTQGPEGGNVCGREGWAAAGWRNEAKFVAIEGAVVRYDMQPECMGFPEEWDKVVTTASFPVRHGTLIPVSCSDGFTNEGDSQVECNTLNVAISYNYTVKPFCEPTVQCRQLPTGWSEIKTNPALPVYESTPLSLSCSPGYLLTGDNLVTCRDGLITFNGTEPACEANIDEWCLRLPGTWNNVVTAEEVALPVPAGYNIPLSCSPGYTLKGAQSVTCTLIGGVPKFLFTFQPPECAERMCLRLLPKLKYLERVQVGYVPHGDLVQLTCIEGYVLDGNNSATCNTHLPEGYNFTFSGPAPKCVPFGTCSSLPDSWTHVRAALPTVHGEKVAVTCDPGFTLQGNSTIKCIAYGVINRFDFDSQPLCLATPPPLQCEQLPVEWAGVWSATTLPVVNNDVVTLMCQVGYYNNGSRQAVCDTLSGTVPTFNYTHQPICIKEKLWRIGFWASSAGITVTVAILLFVLLSAVVGVLVYLHRTDTLYRIFTRPRTGLVEQEVLPVIESRL